MSQALLLDSPAVEVLLDVDREYRDKARAGLLPKIAPRRFNPGNQPWLPVLHTRHGPWHFTALFSNTDLARDMHRTHDWVVICFSDADGEEGQATVVTERRGALAGNRVVRGREPECADYYRALRGASGGFRLAS
jgi:DNA polymerase (family 10)